jgi:hypothetical protein
MPTHLAVHISPTAAACCILPAVSLELSNNQTHILFPTLIANCESMRPPQPVDSLYTCSKKLGPIYIHVFKEIRSYLYTRAQRNSVLFIYTCSKKLVPIYIHVFKEIRFY